MRSRKESKPAEVRNTTEALRFIEDILVNVAVIEK
ncbi:hypothetical protein SAMN05446037_1005157 [Anaerovirgula multivorans]|uniref:Uncharacterized protein n=1 Tax=Anaerovirgula multivorans TaxID=312168 RepID=A0A239CF91_9FIRM|nr:hypothetical protein SAMN05446037_1005157 [Anaerovirgula multivorans]